MSITSSPDDPRNGFGNEKIEVSRGPAEADFSDCRPADQPRYVTDIRKAESHLARNSLPTEQRRLEPGGVVISAP